MWAARDDRTHTSWYLAKRRQTRRSGAAAARKQQGRDPDDRKQHRRCRGKRRVAAGERGAVTTAVGTGTGGGRTRHDRDQRAARGRHAAPARIVAAGGRGVRHPRVARRERSVERERPRVPRNELRDRADGAEPVVYD